MRVALDTNFLVYFDGIAHGPDDEDKVVQAQALFDRMSERATLVVPVQVLGELFAVARRSRKSAAEARDLLTRVAKACETPASDMRAAQDAADLVVNHHLQFWDALIVSAAAAAGCSLLLSEDMQDGFAVRGLTIVNPFAPSLHPKLAQILAR